MGEVIGSLLPLALGVAISPVPIIAVILMLFAPRAGGTGLGFMLGWVVGIVVAVVVFLLVAGATDIGDSDEPSTLASWIKLLLGLLFLLLAVGQWRKRPHDGVEPELPGWMTSIDKVTPGKAAGLGFLLSAVNPKNLAMAIAAGVTIADGALSGGGQTVAVIVFTVIAASTVAVPVIAYAVAADRMRGPLDELKSWLEANNATVMSVLLVVLGVVILGKGLGALL
jgi:threonine/homoserine/homoserine lactone efflux protein